MHADRFRSTKAAVLAAEQGRSGSRARLAHSARASRHGLAAVAAGVAAGRGRSQRQLPQQRHRALVLIAGHLHPPRASPRLHSPARRGAQVTRARRRAPDSARSPRKRGPAWRRPHPRLRAGGERAAGLGGPCPAAALLRARGRRVRVRRRRRQRPRRRARRARGARRRGRRRRRWERLARRRARPQRRALRDGGQRRGRGQAQRAARLGAAAGRLLEQRAQAAAAAGRVGRGGAALGRIAAAARAALRPERAGGLGSHELARPRLKPCARTRRGSDRHCGVAARRERRADPAGGGRARAAAARLVAGRQAAAAIAAWHARDCPRRLRRARPGCMQWRTAFLCSVCTLRLPVTV